ncbi:MAG: hypothetical protein Q8L98_04575 [Chlamydiales bacterium]|nr:hypothetical protein [Chlamydiales bacterium]
MSASVENLIEDMVSNRPGPQLYTQTLGSYATNLPVMTYSMWTILASLQHWIQVVSNEGLVATASMLATSSALSSQASTNLTDKLQDDNTVIQTDVNQKDVDTNKLQADQSQFSTDQTVYGVPVTDYQGVMQQWTQSLQTLTSSIASLVSMATQLEQAAWTPLAQ